MPLNIIKTGGLPPRILLFGVPKIGKSTFGANAPAPIFQQTEDGLDALALDAFPKAKSFEEVLKNAEDLATQPHDFQTYVMDSADHLEPLIWHDVCAESKVDRIELADGGFGKGYVAAVNLWRQYHDACDRLRHDRGMMIINIAHAKVQRFESPVTDAYDRYEVKLHKHASALLVEQSDIILFANYIAGIRKEAESSRQKDDDKRKRGIGSGERMLYAEERPAFIAGNRYGLPAEIPFDKDGAYWSTLASHVPFFSHQQEPEQAAQPAKKKKSA